MLTLALLLSGCGAAGRTERVGDLAVTLETDPTTPLAARATTFRLKLDRAGVPLDGAHVTLTRAMPGMAHHDDGGMLIMQPLGDGRYEAQTAFSMGSRWDVMVAVGVANEPPLVVTFPLEVEQP
jgi:hypothetical protein